MNFFKGLDLKKIQKLRYFHWFFWNIDVRENEHLFKIYYWSSDKYRIIHLLQILYYNKIKSNVPRYLKGA